MHPTLLGCWLQWHHWHVWLSEDSNKSPPKSMPVVMKQSFAILCLLLAAHSTYLAGYFKPICRFTLYIKCISIHFCHIHHTKSLTIFTIMSPITPLKYEIYLVPIVIYVCNIKGPYISNIMLSTVFIMDVTFVWQKVLNA